MTVLMGEVTPSAAARGRWRALLWRAVVVWLVPFVRTAPLVGPEGRPVMSFGVFKTVAVMLLIAVLVLMRRWIPLGWRSTQTVAVYVAVSMLLDLLVLVAGLDVRLGEWALTVLPAYLLVPVVLLARLPRRAATRVDEPPSAAPLSRGGT